MNFVGSDVVRGGRVTSMTLKSTSWVLGLGFLLVGCASTPPPAAPSATTQINQADYTPQEQYEVTFDAKPPAKERVVNEEAPATSLHQNSAAPQKQAGHL